MSVIIEAVKFNHDPASADHCSLNIRKNKSRFVDVPEWVRGVSILAEDSPAAYAIQETAGNTITIQARFSRTNPEIESIEIRAIDPRGRIQAQGCFYYILEKLGAKFVMPPPQVPPANVLGGVKSRQVAFPPAGYTDFETFELHDVRIGSTGVGTNITTWVWQYRLSSTDPWIDFTTTRHKIYTVLEVPKSPWNQIPYAATNDQLPWTDVLNYSCVWAEGLSNRDTAAGEITKRINALGPSLIRYDTNSGANFYNSHRSDTSPGKFYCTEFLERLAGGYGLGDKVNCADCATIVSTFANILGCDLWQSKMHEHESLWGSDSFELNEIIAIGYSNWEVPFYGSFSYHEVAWKGACDVNDNIFDACLKVDGGSDPTSAPHTALLPVNMIFGTCATPLEYRDRLASPTGCPKCNPQPSSKTHREVE